MPSFSEHAKHVHRKDFTKINSSPYALAQFQPKKAMCQSPCFDIEYWRSHRLFLSKKLQLIKIKSHHYCVTLLNAIPYEKLSHWHGFQAQNHNFTASIHSIWSYLSTKSWVFRYWNPPSWYSLFSILLEQHKTAKN